MPQGGGIRLKYNFQPFFTAKLFYTTTQLVTLCKHTSNVSVKLCKKRKKKRSALPMIRPFTITRIDTELASQPSECDHNHGQPRSKGLKAARWDRSEVSSNAASVRRNRSSSARNGVPAYFAPTLSHWCLVLYTKPPRLVNPPKVVSGEVNTTQPHRTPCPAYTRVTEKRCPPESGELTRPGDRHKLKRSTRHHKPMH